MRNPFLDELWPEVIGAVIAVLVMLGGQIPVTLLEAYLARKMADPDSPDVGPEVLHEVGALDFLDVFCPVEQTAGGPVPGNPHAKLWTGHSGVVHAVCLATENQRTLYEHEMVWYGGRQLKEWPPRKEQS